MSQRKDLQASRQEPRDRLGEALEGEDRSAAEEVVEGPYASLLKSAGSAHSLDSDVARNKHKHLAEIYAPRRDER